MLGTRQQVGHQKTSEKNRSGRVQPHGQYPEMAGSCCCGAAITVQTQLSTGHEEPSFEVATSRNNQMLHSDNSAPPQDVSQAALAFVALRGTRSTQPMVPAGGLPSLSQAYQPCAIAAIIARSMTRLPPPPPSAKKETNKYTKLACKVTENRYH
jgi:hypothetical protein